MLEALFLGPPRFWQEWQPDLRHDLRGVLSIDSRESVMLMQVCDLAIAQMRCSLMKPLASAKQTKIISEYTVSKVDP